jgi:hypothetical protein
LDVPGTVHLFPAAKRTPLLDFIEDRTLKRKPFRALSSSGRGYTRATILNGDTIVQIPIQQYYMILECSMQTPQDPMNK